MNQVEFLEYKRDICERLHTMAVVDLRTANRLNMPNVIFKEYEALVSIYAIALVEIKNELLMLKRK